MDAWPDKALIYEINTWVWLDTLSKTHQQNILLNNVPDSVIDELATLGVDIIWLMGVWYRSPAGKTSALNYMNEYRDVLVDITEDDVIGSAYAIGAYEVDERLGGRAGLASFRQRLRERGLKLILDFVPNHVATDHAWVSEHPSYFVRGNTREFNRHRGMFFPTYDSWNRTTFIAHGRDPYFPSWIDTAQMNAFSVEYRRAAKETLLDIASQCDGVRCDMAMLLLNSVFDNTWGDYLEEDIPETEFWGEVIPTIKGQFPHFIFIAEVYWGLEGKLQELGIDYTYDKILYDRIGEGKVNKILEHLQADVNYQKRTVRFSENHDEPRAAANFGVEKSQAAAVLVCTLPGVTLLHDGQFTGRRIKLPVQIRRQPDEILSETLPKFYERLLAELHSPIYADGEWQLFDVRALDDKTQVSASILGYGWRQGEEYRLIIINITGEAARAAVHINHWPELTQHDWCLHDVLTDAYFYRPSSQMNGDGLPIELRAYESNVFRFERVEQSRLMDYPCQLFKQEG